MESLSLKCDAPGCTFTIPARDGQNCQELIGQLQVTVELLSLKFFTCVQESVVMYQEHVVSRHGRFLWVKCKEPGCGFKTPTMGPNFYQAMVAQLQVLFTIATDIVSCVESKTFRCTLLQGTRFSRQVLFQLLPPELIVEPGQMTP